EVARRVVVDGQEIDRLDAPRELACHENRAAGLQPARVWEVRDQLVSLVKQVRRLTELVDRDAEHEERRENERADLELVPRDERRPLHELRLTQKVADVVIFARRHLLGRAKER